MADPDDMKRCAACGAPLVKVGVDDSRQTCGDRCSDCLDPGGTPKPENEIVEQLAAYLEDSLDLSKRAALEIARDRIRGLPAWKGE